ncbi:MAG: hypothetical protein OXC30_00415 [Alphaproteobacteria bacterium]|nr:hypothetical protein [Alphaproteobacteria bacterium]
MKFLWDTRILAIFTIGYNDMLEALKSSMHSACNSIAQVLKEV